MRRIPFLSSVGTGLLLAVVPTRAEGQTSGFPTISTRSFTGGSARLTVSGAFRIEQEVPINTKASYGDGEVTWLQFGESGSAEPNALITYGETKEIGISVGKGKLTATGGIVPGEDSQCSGMVKVTGVAVTGDYACTGVTSYDPATGKMGKVDIKVQFTAES